jgi:hypothetical protein
MKGATFLLVQREREALYRLRNQATKAPVNITGLEERIDAPGGKGGVHKASGRADNDASDGSRRPILDRNRPPDGFDPPLDHVCETSWSSAKPSAVWTVAQQLGFIGGLELCRVWLQKLGESGNAIHVAQPIATASGKA